jgi:hypothetical protein
VHNIILASVAALALLGAGSLAQAADMAAPAGPPTRVQPVDIAPTQPAAGPYQPCTAKCRVVCPDGYSCAPLYGAYGPYGGEAYWGGFTFTGWGRGY